MFDRRAVLTGALAAAAALALPAPVLVPAAVEAAEELRWFIYIDRDVDHVNLRALADSVFGPDPTPGTYVFVIEEGVVIGPSTQEGQASVEVGNWPPGCYVELDVRGSVAVRVRHDDWVSWFSRADGVEAPIHYHYNCRCQ